MSAGFSELGGTIRELWKLKRTLQFLIAYLLYNDGIQTVIAMAGLFLAQELFVARGSHPTERYCLLRSASHNSSPFLVLLPLSKSAHWTSSKTAILVSLVIWSGIVIYGYGFLHTVSEAYFMSGVIGFVLGGSQALSRSLFSQMIPSGREAAFFGIYAISNAAHLGLDRSFLAVWPR